MKKYSLTLIILINLFLLSWQLVLTSYRATQGNELAGYQSALQDMNLQNQRLENQILSQSSLLNVQNQSVKTQLVPAKITFIAPPVVAKASTP